MSDELKLLTDIKKLSRGLYLQLVFECKLLDDAIVRSNEPEEVLSYSYETLGNRFIVPWRKFKGKLRRLVMEQQRQFGIAPECHLRENLCMRCPACLMFGGTGETSQTKAGYNLLSRVLGETLISRLPAGDIHSLTANAVDEEDLTTGQALMTTMLVPAETSFLGVLTLRDPTRQLAAVLVDNLSRLTRLGASTREWGRCRTSILGYVISDRETLSAYDLAALKTEGIATKVSALEALGLELKPKENLEALNTAVGKLLPGKENTTKAGATARKP